MYDGNDKNIKCFDYILSESADIILSEMET